MASCGSRPMSNFLAYFEQYRHDKPRPVDRVQVFQCRAASNSAPLWSRQGGWGNFTKGGIESDRWNLLPAWKKTRPKTKGGLEGADLNTRGSLGITPIRASWENWVVRGRDRGTRQKNDVQPCSPIGGHTDQPPTKKKIEEANIHRWYAQGKKQRGTAFYQY